MHYSAHPFERRRRDFALEVIPDRDRVLVAPMGELDLSTVDEVWERIQQLRRDGVESVVLDLRRLTFMDSTALRLIVRAREMAQQDGFSFALIDGNEVACRVLDVTGLREHLRFTRP